MANTINPATKYIVFRAASCALIWSILGALNTIYFVAGLMAYPMIDIELL
jgi:hypothetical protein